MSPFLQKRRMGGRVSEGTQTMAAGSNRSDGLPHPPPPTYEVVNIIILFKTYLAMCFPVHVIHEVVHCASFGCLISTMNMFSLSLDSLEFSEFHYHTFKLFCI